MSHKYRFISSNCCQQCTQLTFKDVNFLADHDKKPDEENGCPNCRPRTFCDRPEHKHVHSKRKSVQLWNTVLTWHEGLRHSVAGALNALIYMYFLNVRLQLLSALRLVKCPSFLRTGTGKCNACLHSAQIKNVDLATRRTSDIFLSVSTKRSRNTLS